ncbi:MAG: glycosyltransferase [Anaerolineae bacterium]|nr:glycosyltransferase [Anaerolineae bacterium]
MTKPRIRVCHVLSSLQLGGVERQLANYLRASDSSQFEHHVISIGQSGPLLEELQQMGVATVVIGKSPGKLDLFRATGELRRTMQRIRPQIVHTHRFAAGWRARLTALTIRPRPALFHTEHGLNPWKKGLYLWLDRALARVTDVLISVSSPSFQLRQTREKYPLHKSHLIPIGIDMARFDTSGHGEAVRAELGIPASAILVVVVARLEPVKNIETLVRAFAVLDERYHLLVVGGGSAFEDLQAQVAALGLEARVSMPGYRSDIPDVLAAADIFCLPSLREDFPVSVLEAMASARPVIASRVGGIPDMVVDGETGLLFDSGDADQLVQAIRVYGEDEAQRLAAGQKGRARVVAEFSLARQVEQLEALYHQFAARANAAHRQERTDED